MAKLVLIKFNEPAARRLAEFLGIRGDRARTSSLMNGAISRSLTDVSLQGREAGRRSRNSMGSNMVRDQWFSAC